MDLTVDHVNYQEAPSLSATVSMALAAGRSTVNSPLECWQQVRQAWSKINANIRFMQQELPENELPDPLRAEVTRVCESFAGALMEVYSEMAKADAAFDPATKVANRPAALAALPQSG